MTSGDHAGRAHASTTAPLQLADPRYRALVRSLPHSAILLLDHDLRFVLVDGPELEAAGFSKARLEGRTTHEALPEDFAQLVAENVRRVLAGETFSAELPFEDRFYEYNYVPIRDDAGAVLYGMILALNITERRRAEAARSRSDKRFEGIFRDSPEALMVTRERDGLVLEVNRSFETIAGWSRAEVVGKTTVELDLWVDPTQRSELMQVLRAQGQVHGFELLLRRKDRSQLQGLMSIRSFEFDGQACLLGTFRDVSEQRAAREALAQSEERLRGLADATFEGIAIGEAGRLIDVNDQFVRMYQSTREALLGCEVSTLVAPESRELVRSSMAAPTTEPYEHMALRPDGSIFPVEVRPRWMNITGRRMRVTAVRDVTERKRAEAERERLIAELRARNSEMEQFTYTVSHDLKSPLVTIKGFLGMLEHDLVEGDLARTRADLQRIGFAADKMMRLLNGLLELSRIGRVGSAPACVSLSEIVKEALELLSGPCAARGVRVRCGALPEVFGDRERLLQVVQNLVENAIKYMGANPAPAIEISAEVGPEHVRCVIEDNGIGVDPKYAERIFGLFEKLDAKSEGTGVGLALVRRIMEFHAGRVWVESDGVAGHGSRFIFELPGGPALLSENRAAGG